MIHEPAQNVMGVDAAPVVGVLGSTVVANADGTRSAVAGQQGDVLALLVAMHPSGVRTDVLYEVLWGERAPRTAATGLRVVVNRLRDRLSHVHPDAIVNEAGHYRLVLDADQIDMHLFDLRAAEARRSIEAGEVDAGIEHYEASLALWRGESFQSTGDLGPLIGVQTRLDESKAEAEERLVEALMLAGRNDDAVVMASGIMRDFELRERRWELLVLALYRAGRQAEALRAFRRGVGVLADEYGLLPGPKLAELELRILDQDASLLIDGPDSAGLDHFDTGVTVTSILEAIKRSPVVPSIVAPLVGRDADLTNLAELLTSRRLITIVGPAGVGKTRLATQLAQDARHGRVIWLDLVVHEPGTIVEELASQLGVGGHGGAVIDGVLRALATAPTLLVFDNCEHVIDSIVPIAEAMVQHCPTLRIVSTSRVAFNSQSETSVHLEPLDRDSARRLVLDRLAGVEGRTEIPDDSLNALVDGVDRIPLALELVASRLRTRPIGDVLSDLNHSLAALGGSRRTDKRHEGLIEALNWSTDLLEADVLVVYEALGVMVGSFRAREMADLLELPVEEVRWRLEALVDLSLVTMPGVSDRSTYRALQTVRLHAQGMLAAAHTLEPMRVRHARVFGALAHTLAERLTGPDEESAVATLRLSLGQLRGAFHWALHHDLELAQQIAIDLWEYAFLRLDFGLVPMSITAVAAMEQQGSDPSPDLLATASFASWAVGLIDEGAKLSEDAERSALELGVSIPIRALQCRANIASMTADDKAAEVAVLAALEAARESSNPCREADVLVGVVLGLVKVGMGDHAVGVAETCVGVATDVQNASLLAWARYGRGIAHVETDPRLAKRELVESIRVARTVNNRWVEGMATAALVREHTRHGQHVDAARLLIPLIEVWRAAGMAGMVVQSARQAALTLESAGCREAALGVVVALDGLGSTPSLLDFDTGDYERLAGRVGFDHDIDPRHPLRSVGGPTASRPPPAATPVSEAVLDAVTFEIRTLLAQELRPAPELRPSGQ